MPKRLERTLDAARGLALDPIRSELFGVERFEQHGRSLGATHRAGPARFGQATFYPRLQSNVRTLRAAHQFIALEALDQRQARLGEDLPLFQQLPGLFA